MAVASVCDAIYAAVGYGRPCGAFLEHGYSVACVAADPNVNYDDLWTPMALVLDDFDDFDKGSSHTASLSSVPTCFLMCLGFVGLWSRCGCC